MKTIALLLSSTLLLNAVEPPSWSGIYPSLAFFNNEGECGTGAVVPWADRLWAITYAPHKPLGSTDKLYEITPDLKQIIRPESVGGTPANRMIHRESGQLIIGPYFIDKDRNVRVIPPKAMPGRLTGNARHLTDPAGKIYFATMEEGLYEVDVKSLAVTGLIKDSNPTKPGDTEEKNPASVSSKLPGYHGKGLYSGQGRVVYANNGEKSPAAEADPRTPSGALAEWKGEGDWELVRRNQFTEVTGPGGIEGSSNPEKDPIWSMGWDSKSLILMVLDGGAWHPYRLPKASHSYDGAHGWNTEWPRIRDIGETDLLMTMHGMFWHFPKNFSPSQTAGIRPRSTYLKVIGDFCRWNDRLVFGCDDTAKSAFLNKKSGEDTLAEPGQSQSNLWFTTPDTLDRLGPAIGSGAFWLREKVKAGTPSDPFLFAGFQRRVLWLSHQSDETTEFTIEVDLDGRGEWQTLRSIKLPPKGSECISFNAGEKAEWLRLRVDRDSSSASAIFVYSNPDTRGTGSDPMFKGLAEITSKKSSTGWLRARGENQRTLLVAVPDQPGGKPSAGTCYELDAAMNLNPIERPKAKDELKLGTALAGESFSVDASSVVYTGPDGSRWRLPRSNESFDAILNGGLVRTKREVSTERFLLNMHGTFYELPSDNAGGFTKIRPVASHRCDIGDFASYRGLLVMTGIDGGKDNPHIIRSDDGKAAVWAGAIDDLWKLGKPTGTGGPWLDSTIRANAPSDPYLFTGYDKKTLLLTNKGNADVSFRVEIDSTGEGDWFSYQNISVKTGETMKHEFPPNIQGCWLRLVSSGDTTATARLEYQ